VTRPRLGYIFYMGLLEAGAWGIAGGLAAGALSWMGTVTRASFHFPPRDQIWGRLFVLTCGIILGAIVAAADHSDMTGPWPAFIMGVGAPSVVRGLLTGVEAIERKSSEDEDHAKSGG
jgi:hypothetical protein